MINKGLELMSQVSETVSRSHNDKLCGLIPLLAIRRPVTVVTLLLRSWCLNLRAELQPPPPQDPSSDQYDQYTKRGGVRGSDYATAIILSKRPPQPQFVLF